jgi:hypothetical protein
LFAGLLYADQNCPSLNGAQPFGVVILAEPEGAWVLASASDKTWPIGENCQVPKNALLRTARKAPRGSDSKIAVKLLTEKPEVVPLTCYSYQDCQLPLTGAGKLSPLLLAIAEILRGQPLLGRSAITQLDGGLRDGIVWVEDRKISLKGILSASAAGDYNLQLENKDPAHLEVQGTTVRLDWNTSRDTIPEAIDDGSSKVVLTPGLYLLHATGNGSTSTAWVLIAPSPAVGQQLSKDREELQRSWPSGTESGEKAFLLAHLVYAAQASVTAKPQ